MTAELARSRGYEVDNSSYAYVEVLGNQDIKIDDRYKESLLYPDSPDSESELEDKLCNITGQKLADYLESQLEVVE